MSPWLITNTPLGPELLATSGVDSPREGGRLDADKSTRQTNGLFALSIKNINTKIVTIGQI